MDDLRLIGLLAFDWQEIGILRLHVNGTPDVGLKLQIVSAQHRVIASHHCALVNRPAEIGGIELEGNLPRLPRRHLVVPGPRSCAAATRLYLFNLEHGRADVCENEVVLWMVRGLNLPKV